MKALLALCFILHFIAALEYLNKKRAIDMHFIVVSVS